MILAEETLFTIPCEAIFNTHPEVARTALVGVKRQWPGRARDLRRAAQCGCADRNRHASAQELLERGAAFPHTWRIKTILFHPSFPVDIRHNAKIFREKLAVWAARRLS